MKCAVGIALLAAALTANGATLLDESVLDAGSGGAAVQVELKALGCVNTDPMPTAPQPGAESVAFDGTTYSAGFHAVIWRQTCATTVTTSRLFIRVTPTLSAPFLCGLDFHAIVTGAQHAVGLQPNGGSSATFCDYLYVPTTWLIGQYSGDNYDRDQAITFIYDGGGPTSTANLSARGTGGTPTIITPVVGLWWNPNESGSGYALDYKHGVLVVTIYSYAPNGNAQWYLAAGPVTNNVFIATLDKYTSGQCISCAYNGTPIEAGSDGIITITFTSATSATVSLPGGRATLIQPEAF